MSLQSLSVKDTVLKYEMFSRSNFDVSNNFINVSWNALIDLLLRCFHRQGVHTQTRHKVYSRKNVISIW